MELCDTASLPIVRPAAWSKFLSRPFLLALAEPGWNGHGPVGLEARRPEVVTDSRAMAANASASVREKRPDIPAIYFHGPPPMVQRLGEDMDIAYL